MNNLNIGDVVRIKSKAWYLKNSDDKGIALSNIGDDKFYPIMAKYCGALCKVRNIHDHVIILVTIDNKLIPYRFYEDWLEIVTDGQQVINKDSEDIAYYKVTLEQAKEFWNSCNSILQEIAMQCFPIEKLTEM